MHDVAPATWTRCASLLKAMSEVAPVPFTLLVVPNYHRQGDRVPDWYEQALREHLARGDELALHGYAHQDEAPLPRTPRQWWRRRIMTAAEGEFSALDTSAARNRLSAGLGWCRQHGWPVEGFVAPAWLLSPGTWQALENLPLSYTTTATGFHLLHPRRSVDMPAIAYSTRSRARLGLSLAWHGLRPLPRAPGVRIALHPDDAGQPAVIRQLQGLLESLLRSRMALTKRAFAAALLGRRPPQAAAGAPAGDKAPYAGSTSASESVASVAPRAEPASTSLG
ncbi:DUF2334 domain-containing protein [Azoarcus indigens]|uniref:Deacetylase n=2 Tax=Azoarcus indigens TaxID=29545 RepID=A0A4R6EDP6_9RHOO|nr:DUF2334 domain-containing protein [Azoarcus indigens]TDN55874.1 hypothetical protein C7389_103212 [Azoarcus indigens]